MRTIAVWRLERDPATPDPATPRGVTDLHCVQRASGNGKFWVFSCVYTRFTDEYGVLKVMYTDPYTVVYTTPRGRGGRGARAARLRGLRHATSEGTVQ